MRTAIIGFGKTHEAERRIAGLPWAARVARALAEEGYDEASFVVPALQPATMREIARLAPGLRIEFVHGSGEIEPLIIRPPSDIEILRATAKASDGPVSRLINRPVSRLISRLALLIPGVRPLHVTLANFAVAILTFAALVAGGDPGLIAGALLFQAASILDGVDGEIARATFRASRSGALFDSIVDAATTLLFILGLALNLDARGNQAALALALWGLALFLFGLAVIAWRSRGGGGFFNFNFIKRHYRDRVSGRWLPELIGFLVVVSSRDFFALLFAALVLIGLPMVALYIFTAAATIWILFVVGSLRLSSAAEAAGA